MWESRQLPNYRGSLYLRNMDPGTDQLHFFTFLTRVLLLRDQMISRLGSANIQFVPLWKGPVHEDLFFEGVGEQYQVHLPGRCHADRQLFTRQIHYNRRTNSQQQCNNIQETLQVNCMCRQ